MDNGLFISLVNPAIALTLAMAFLALWLYRRDRPHLVLIAMAYTGSAVGFLLQYFTLPIGLPATKLFSNLGFMVASLGIAATVIRQCGRQVPWFGMGLFVVGGLAGFSWFIFVEPDITLRVLLLNFSIGGISLVVAAELRVIRDKTPIQKVMLALAVLSGMNFLVRPVVSVALNGPFTGYENLYSSLYWTTALFSHAILSLMIALCLFTVEALDLTATLRSESLTDPLSGLLNRRGFETKASKLLDSCISSGLPVSLVVADLDRFKSLNDRHGHAAGDKVIIEFATRLRDAAGSRAVAARIGGEEFAVLLPMADPAAARLFAEAVRTVFSGNAIAGLPLDVRVTGSFGISSHSGGESLDDMLHRADEALYHAKKSGRDGVRVSYQRLPEAVASDPAAWVA
ncbi:MAG: GGDEF domain-containing protein [Mesorhizobium sp.]|nr:GGDEF domain-containing protein [Mesorhizobium sp.]MBL8576596.1 GGDEF domain-containing protein [Mesorhizobium sp.]